MGFRTVVILYNDQASEWEKDPELGRKIATGMNYAAGGNYDWNSPANLHYGNVMSCEHADNATMTVIDGYYGRRLATTSMGWKEKPEVIDFQLIRSVADVMGFRLVKKSEK